MPHSVPPGILEIVQGERARSSLNIMLLSTLFIVDLLLDLLLLALLL